MLKLSEETEKKIQELLDNTSTLFWSMALKNLFTLILQVIAIWLIFRLYMQLQILI